MATAEGPTAMALQQQGDILHVFSAAGWLRRDRNETYVSCIHFSSMENIGLTATKISPSILPPL
jgi:hypothetical protein